MDKQQWQDVFGLHHADVNTVNTFQETELCTGYNASHKFGKNTFLYLFVLLNEMIK